MLALVVAAAWLADESIVVRGTRAEGALELVRGTAEGVTSNTWRLGGELDVGVAPGLQIGGGVTGAISPDSSFGSAALRVVTRLAPSAALRIDAGTYKRDANYEFIGGVGLPARFALSHQFAISLGRILALPPIGPNLLAGFQSADDIFTLDLNRSNVTATIGLPIALTFEPAQGVAFAARIAPRHGWGGGNYSHDWLPVGADLILRGGMLHLVLSAEHTDLEGIGVFVGRATAGVSF